MSSGWWTRRFRLSTSARYPDFYSWSWLQYGNMGRLVLWTMSVCWSKLFVVNWPVASLD